jgi:hypothetical protein
MSTQVQYRRGTGAENNAFVGALAEITVDTTNGTLRVHNGITAGGSNIATVAYVDNALSALSADSISNGTSNVKVLSSNGNVAVTVNGSGIVTFAAAGMLNNMGNGVGNIGNSTGYFNTVFAKATSAQYADVAEQYLADSDYVSGTVVEIGGPAEVTATTHYASSRVAGVISTEPALIMNSSADGEHVATVALLGRVPCRVVGPVQRGDLVCSSDIPGVATALRADQYRPGVVIGKALEEHAGSYETVIEVLVGRL